MASCLGEEQNILTEEKTTKWNRVMQRHTDVTGGDSRGLLTCWYRSASVLSPAEFIHIHLFYWSVLENEQQLWGKLKILQLCFLFINFSWLPLKVALVCNVGDDKNSKKNIL